MIVIQGSSNFVTSEKSSITGSYDQLGLKSMSMTGPQLLNFQKSFGADVSPKIQTVFSLVRQVSYLPSPSVISQLFLANLDLPACSSPFRWAPVSSLLDFASARHTSCHT